MKIRFWGVQGSIPNPLTTAQLRQKVRSILHAARHESLDNEQEIDAFIEDLPLSLNHTTGGNTTCYEIKSDREQRLIIDAGTGIRKLGHNLMQHDQVDVDEVHLLMTHLHWDHINGFPFFAPAFDADTTIHIYGVHDYLEEGFKRQFHEQNFPLQFNKLPADIRFHVVEEGEQFELQGYQIDTHKLDHPNDSYSYKISRKGRTVVVATDAEYKKLDQQYLEPYINFFRDSDMIVFDSQYTMKEMLNKIDWGHSSPYVGVDVCLMSNIPHLVMTHFDPSYTDDKMTEILSRTESFKQHAMKSHTSHFEYDDLQITLAYEGLELML